MRVGVSTKVFLAYAVLLTAFAATSAFSVAYLHSTRQQVATHNELLKVQSAIESCWRQLEAQALNTKKERSGDFFERTSFTLEKARQGIGRFLEQEAGTRRRQDFAEYLADIARLEVLTRETTAAIPLLFQDRKDEFNRRDKELRNAVDLLRNRLLNDSGNITEELAEKQRGATNVAIGLGIAGLLGAIGAAVSLWRTLRPLSELRVRAQQIGSGDYDRRIGLGSQDEIGDLAREFDNMAQALQEREQRLIHSERLATVGKVAAQITHEIRNPLASIGLSAELLGDELTPTQGEANRLLGAISGEIDRLSEITESYLRFVRLPRPVVEREDPVALVTSVMEFARAELAQAGIALELHAPPTVPEIAADENQVRQALLNLIRNAREAMPGGGHLRVDIANPPGRVTVAITDSGAGIAEADQARIFEPFFSTKASGTGLGLALVQQIVAEHGGEISVESPAKVPNPLSSAGAPGPGTTFRLDFPAVASTAASKAPASSGDQARAATVAAPSALAAFGMPPTKR
jgi:signal transduction histidine kinase